MALERISKGLYESQHFRMHSPEYRQKLVWYVVEARTPEGAQHLPTPTTHLPNKDARAMIARMEQEITFNVPYLPRIAALPLVTHEDFARFRSACFPGLSIMQGRRQFAKVLGMSVGHVKHLERGRKQLNPRTATLLRAYAQRLVSKKRTAFKQDAKSLEPFTELYEALSTEDE